MRSIHLPIPGSHELPDAPTATVETVTDARTVSGWRNTCWSTGKAFMFYTNLKTIPHFLFSLNYPFVFAVGAVGGTSYHTLDVSGVSANVMLRRSAVSSWSFVCCTTEEMRTLRVSSGSSSRRPRTGVNPKHYSTTLVRICTQTSSDVFNLMNERQFPRWLYMRSFE